MPLNLSLPHNLPFVDAVRFRYSEEGPSLIASEFGYAPNTVVKTAGRLGLGSTHWRRRQGISHSKTSDSVNHDYFKEWSANMAWLLGYIFADGNVHVARGRNILRFLCTRSDAHILFSIKHELRAKANVRIGTKSYTYNRQGRSYVSRPTASLQISSRGIVEDLASQFGVLPRKSSLDIDCPDVPIEFLPHFVRGNFDGDGCISSRRASPQNATACWLGSRRFLDGLQSGICLATGLPIRKVRKEGRVLHRISWGARAHVRQLYGWMYPPGEYIFLKRKRDKFIDIGIC